MVDAMMDINVAFSSDGDVKMWLAVVLEGDVSVLAWMLQ